MSIKQNQFSKLKLVVIITVVVLAVSASATGFYLASRSEPQASADTNAQTSPSLFSFTGADGWRKGPSNETSMALFNSDDTCFAYVHYKPGTVDALVEVAKTREGWTSDGYGVTDLGIQTIKIQTAGEGKSYELHQSSVVTPKGMTKLYGAHQHGYQQLEEGYLEIHGYCNEVEQLIGIVPALEAISMRKP